jgi:hypothetical protein
MSPHCNRYRYTVSPIGAEGDLSAFSQASSGCYLATSASPSIGQLRMWVEAVGVHREAPPDGFTDPRRPVLDGRVS